MNGLSQSHLLPAVILAGSDRKPGPIPRGAERYAFLVGYKGADIRVGDRPLIQVLRERLLQSGAFSLVLVAGPREIYEPLLPGAVLHTDKDIGRNLARIFRFFRWAERICLVACDILPRVEEIKEAIRLWQEAGQPDFWLPLVEAQNQLGSSSWKPRYGLCPGPGEPAKPFLPGHLGILQLKAVRLRFLCKLATLLYRLRNREQEERRRVLYALVIGDLLAQDLVNLLRFRIPSLTWRTLRRGWQLYSLLRKNRLQIEQLESALRDVVLKQRWRDRATVRLTPCTLWGLAQDLDTLGEVKEVGASWHGGLLRPKGK